MPLAHHCHDRRPCLARHRARERQWARFGAPAGTTREWGTTVTAVAAARVPMRGRFIYAGIADRVVVHPREQVVLLWEHWSKLEIVWYQGGHTGCFEARPVQRFVEAAVVQSGLLD